MREKISGHTGQVNSVEYISDLTAELQGCLLSSSDDGTARIWDLRSNKGVMLLKH